MPNSFTRAAAVSSCVDNGFEAHSATWAPPALRVIMRTAVSVVTCMHAPPPLPRAPLALLRPPPPPPPPGQSLRRPSYLALPRRGEKSFLAVGGVPPPPFPLFGGRPGPRPAGPPGGVVPPAGGPFSS